MLEKLGAPVPEAEQSSQNWNGRIVVRASSTGGVGWFVFVPISDKQAFVESLGDLPQAEAEAARLVRIENGRARYGEEITERFLLQETGQMRAVSFSKGCYLGQEIVERVRSRGQVHRHLLPVQIETENVPAAGTKLTRADGKDLAEIMSAAFSPALNKVVAMAYVRTDAARPGFELHWNEAHAVTVAAASR
jgi:aminomethyltransferase